MSDNLTFFAGNKALAIIKEEGLQPERIRVIAGAAGGPKWLVLNYLDRVIFSQWLRPRNDPVFLVGSSIGAWRFAAISTKDPIEAIENFQYAYIHQSYESKPTPDQVTQTSSHVLDTYLDDEKTVDVLNHPDFRLNVMTVRSRRPVQTEKKLLLAAGLAAAFLANSVSRSLLKYFFERALFYDPRNLPPFFNMDQFPIRKTPLDKDNMKHALLASGSIPLIMSGIHNIPNAYPGMYRDGGILDYHPDLPFTEGEGIVLFPHYTDRIIPGWMDKKLSWRKPSRSHMENVVLVAPSRKFIEKLPFKKIPDRNDFYLFKGKQKERISYWNSVVEQSKLLGEEFLEVLRTNKIREVIKPMKQFK